MNVTTTCNASAHRSHTPRRHNILIVTPQHQPSIWKTQSTTSIQAKTRSKVVISFSCNVTSNQVSTQHMQVVRKAVQTIPCMYWSLHFIHSGKKKKLRLTEMLTLEATNSLLCRHLNLHIKNFVIRVHYGRYCTDHVSTDSAVSSDSPERQILLKLFSSTELYLLVYFET